MKKSEQNKLIDKVKKSEKPNQDCREFKRLQMYWYGKLDEAGFDDIERTGKNRHRFLDEYSGYVKHSSFKFAAKYTPETQAYYETLRKFSWHGKVRPNSALFPLKSHEIKQKSTKNLNRTIKPTNSSCDTTTSSDSKAHSPSSCDSPVQKRRARLLSKSDRVLLRMYGNGKIFTEISKYLRRYLSHHAPLNRTGPKGKPFSVFYCYNRLKRLERGIQTGEIYIPLERVSKSEGGGVKKSGFD